MDFSTLPKLGFGLMRLPVIGGGFFGPVDHEQVGKMVDAYMARGFNYFDTAYMYHGGQSESAVKEALVKRYPRDSFYLATKFPVWEVKHADDRDRIFNTQLERAGVEYFDFYLLHGIEDANIQRYADYDCFAWGQQKKAEGKIKHFGFSFHGTPALLEQLLTEHPELEFAQVQLNYADWNSPLVQSGRLYEILQKYHTPIIVMEPVKGGMLAHTTPEVEKLMTGHRPGDSIASWALRFAGSLEGVVTILSGMSSEEQINDNLNTFTHFEPINEAERGILDAVVQAMAKLPAIACTACRYCCDGCPADIQIPEIFKTLNTLRMYGEDMRPRIFYNSLTGGRAKECSACGQCENLCPQHLPVIALMKEASDQLDVAWGPPPRPAD